MTPDPSRARRLVWEPGDLTIVKPGKSPPSGPARRPLSAVRVARGVTQADLAQRLGIDQSQISRLEQRDDFRMATLVDYLIALGAETIVIDVKFNDASSEQLPLRIGADSHADS